MMKRPNEWCEEVSISTNRTLACSTLAVKLVISSLYCDDLHLFVVVFALEVLLSRLDMLPTSGVAVGDIFASKNVIHYNIEAQDDVSISYLCIL